MNPIQNALALAKEIRTCEKLKKIAEKKESILLNDGSMINVGLAEEKVDFILLSTKSVDDSRENTLLGYRPDGDLKFVSLNRTDLFTDEKGPITDVSIILETLSRYPPPALRFVVALLQTKLYLT